MKKHLIAACILASLSSGVLRAQQADLLLKAPSYSALSSQAKDGTMYVIGEIQQVQGHNALSSGEWIKRENGSLLWRYTISAPGAQGLDLYFDKLVLPEAAAMVLRAPDNRFVAGPYFASDVSGDAFATGAVPGENAVLEVWFPEGDIQTFEAQISGSGYLYRGLNQLLEKDAGDLGASEPCEVNANCSEGSSWGDQKRSVVKIKVRDGSLIGLCSGALVNNTAQDCKNYLLTAQHCGAGATTSNLNQWVFYFNFEAPGCSTPGSATALDDQTITGCVRRAASGTVSEVELSDFMLVELNKSIPAAYNVYYAGWTRTGTSSASGVGIHHPAGDLKKISTYTSALSNSSWTGTPGTHWRVSWAATTNGHGVTEGGSSGSPLFDNSGRITGDLSGGSSDCAAPTQGDLYGKFAYSWESAGSSSDRRLRPWLDPAAQNPSTLNGRNACTTASAAPVADFTADQTLVALNGIVYLTQLCTNSPTSYSWSISPPVGWLYTFGNATSPYPGVRLVTLGCYTVTLTATNSAGSDTETKTEYICAGIASSEEAELAGVQVFPNPASDLLHVQLSEPGAAEYRLMNIQGKVVQSGMLINGRISVTQLAAGTYYLHIKTGKMQQTLPVVVAH